MSVVAGSCRSTKSVDVYKRQALKHPGMVIVDKEVVRKSFADYWKELQKLGLEIEEVK